MGASKMTGTRKWEFKVGTSTIEMESTDFYLEYSAEARDDGRVLLGVTMRACWEHSDFNYAGLARRIYVEDRLQDLAWTLSGQKGTLTLDKSTAQERVLSNITLKGLSPQLSKSNELLKYDLQFEYPLYSEGQRIARTLTFNERGLNAENFIVHYVREDRTAFTPVFRAAPIRIENGPGLKTILVTAIRQDVAGATDLAKRQAIEAEIKAWAWNHQGVSAELILDGSSAGTCHLREIRPSDLSLPDAVVFEMEFVTGYGS